MAGDAPVLVVDDDAASRQAVADTLTQAGMSAVLVGGGAEALEYLATHPAPSVVLLDLVMPEPDGYKILHFLRHHPRLSSLPVVMLTAADSDEEVARMFARGADDYVHKPFRPAELIARLKVQMRVREYVERLSRRERDQETVLELTQTLASTLDIHDILFTVVQRVAEIARVDRCSIVLFSESGELGYVLATSDDEQLRDLPIELSRYPEIRQVLATGEALIIRNAAESPLLDVVRQGETGLGFSSLALVPILHEGAPMGVLFLRSKTVATFDDHELRLITTIANASAIAVRNARILQQLRTETEETAQARDEAERRVKFFRRYADFFESAADGMVVIDRAGRVLFANPRAREILGASEAELVRQEFETLFAESERERAARLRRGFQAGVYPRAVDIAFRSKSGDSLIANISFSSVLHEDSAVLFTFRDVTQERRTAIELKQTKEFLESVIESSVDGIVSADLKGTVIIFNRAAARIFGYAPEDVLGKLNVEKLYPAGGAKEVMRNIRDPELNGYGRLQEYRVDMLSADGRPLAVQLSAALVLDNGHTIGSVGIFTDIREKIRIQNELEKTQEELRSKEKQAIVAELAGAAAHELNQPLTSVIGYSELLRRQLDPNSPLLQAVSVIISESERMAEIVRKVGRITKYETKTYVGGARILDLEKASGADSGSEEVPT